MSKKTSASKPAKKSPAKKPVPKPKSSPTAAVSPTSGPSAKKTGTGATKATKRPVANEAPPAPAAPDAPVAPPVPTKPAKRPPVPLAKSNPRTQPKHLSAIDAAAMVLAEAKDPMTCKAMVEVMAEQGLWKPATGKTPEATLYSSIHREIAKKKTEARFRKTGRGLFEVAR
ncbi:MAG: hypothetical protein ACI89L_002461 [Phycisphaerales bacterium]|jgi:hypothetical protein